MTGDLRPALAVVAGQPTAEELAAVIITLTALSARATEAAGSAAPNAAPRSAWSASSQLMRDPVTAGPGAWRASALPR
jgi:hypothetical protein